MGRYLQFMENQPKSGIGINLNKDTPKISYLIFADDCIIFLGQIKTATKNIKQVLDHYFMVSGQLVNCQNFRIQFSNCVSNTNKKIISQILQISVSNRIGTYLGCMNIDQKKKIGIETSWMEILNSRLQVKYA